MSGGGGVFVTWEEQVICQERGNRVIHFYLKDALGNSVLAVVGTERSVRHMMYVVPDHFLQAYGSTQPINAFKWRARREVVDWLTCLVSRNRSHHAGVQLDDSAQAVESLKILTPGINVNSRILPDKMIYKIVAKVLVTRLKKVLPIIIDVRQSAFIEGRHLLHSVLIANEVAEEAKRCNKSCLVFKVDYEKAYDSISWEFLTYMMKRMGFCPKWISWIEGCLKSASISVLVNGSPTAEFYPHRGLRQGYPLAPFLFNIVAEGLTGLMREAQMKKLYDSFKVGRNQVDISILQYADDTIFFGTTSMENVTAIKVMLRSFEMVSGLKINCNKCKFGAFGKNEQWINSAASYLNCRVLSIPFPYLGVPIGANPKC